MLYKSVLSDNHNGFGGALAVTGVKYLMINEIVCTGNKADVSGGCLMYQTDDHSNLNGT